MLIPAGLAVVTIGLALRSLHKRLGASMTRRPRPGPSDHELNTTRTSASASVGLARRSLRNIVRLPVGVPAVDHDAGRPGDRLLRHVLRDHPDPGFPTDRSINWFLPLAVLMGCGFAGIGIGFAMIRDLETGFYDRIRMTPAPRSSLIGGQVLAALIRALDRHRDRRHRRLMFGARLTHGPLGLGPLFVAGLGIAVMGTGWGLGLAYRFRDMRGAAIMQLTFFLVLFLTEAQTPLNVMEGWLEQVARDQPVHQPAPSLPARVRRRRRHVEQRLGRPARRSSCSPCSPCGSRRPA